jgi:hypothetical protein
LTVRGFKKSKNEAPVFQNTISTENANAFIELQNNNTERCFIEENT